MHTRRAAPANSVKTIAFTKMQGCGNDYIYINCMDEEVSNPEELTVKLSDRHFGVGGDGVILICHSDVAAAKMRIFNLDGSEGKCAAMASAVSANIFMTIILSILIGFRLKP